MARSVGIPNTIASVLQALVLLFVVGFTVLEDKKLLNFRKKGGEKHA